MQKKLAETRGVRICCGTFTEAAAGADVWVRIAEVAGFFGATKGLLRALQKEVLGDLGFYS